MIHLTRYQREVLGRDPIKMTLSLFFSSLATENRLERNLDDELLKTGCFVNNNEDPSELSLAYTSPRLAVPTGLRTAPHGHSASLLKQYLWKTDLHDLHLWISSSS